MTRSAEQRVGEHRRPRHRAAAAARAPSGVTRGTKLVQLVRSIARSFLIAFPGRPLRNNLRFVINQSRTPSAGEAPMRRVYSQRGDVENPTVGTPRGRAASREPTPYLPLCSPAAAASVGGALPVGKLTQGLRSRKLHLAADLCGSNNSIICLHLPGADDRD